jgi:cytosolic iron-sulfur protein assembly protein CIAO1
MTSNPPETSPPTLTHLATLSSPAITRAWQSTPHPHNALLATATADKSVGVWSLRDFRLVSTITGGHKRSIRSVAWKDTGKSRSGAVVLATGSFDSNTGIWTRNDGRVRNGVAGDEEEEEELYGGAEDAQGGEEEEEDGEGEEEWAFSSLLTGPDSEIKGVAFSPTNPALLATSSRDKSVWVWEDVAESAGGGGFTGAAGGDDSEYETVAVLAEHTGDVKCVAWHPGREVLASGSYDDTVRLWRDVEEEGDWCCVGVLEGHEGTVWGIAWEGLKAVGQSGDAEEKEDVGVGVGVKEPRLASCSDDLSVRIWRKVSKERERENKGPRLPSIIRPPSSMETWVQEATLPQMHVRSVYAVAWSSITGLLVSCGGDGGIYVYKERPVQHKHETRPNGEAEAEADDVVMNGTQDSGSSEKVTTEWVVVAQIEAAHAEFEINHVCWARRQDRDKRHDDEEVIVSSGDDGAVRVWALPEF